MFQKWSHVKARGFTPLSPVIRTASDKLALQHPHESSAKAPRKLPRLFQSVKTRARGTLSIANFGNCPILAISRLLVHPSARRRRLRLRWLAQVAEGPQAN